MAGVGRYWPVFQSGGTLVAHREQVATANPTQAGTMMSSESLGPNLRAPHSAATPTVHHGNHATGLAGADAPTTASMPKSPLPASPLSNKACFSPQHRGQPSTPPTPPIVTVTGAVPPGPHQRPTSPLKPALEEGGRKPLARRSSQGQQGQQGRTAYPMGKTSPALLDRANTADALLPADLHAKVQLSDRPRSKSNTLPAHLRSRPTRRTESTSSSASPPSATARARSPSRLRSRRRGHSLGHRHNHGHQPKRQASTLLCVDADMPSRTSTLSTKATTLSMRRQPSQLHLSNSVTSLKHTTRSPAMLSLQTAMMGMDVGGAGDSGDETGSGSAAQNKGAGSGSRPASNRSGASPGVDRVRSTAVQRNPSQTHLTHVISRYMDHFPHSRPTTPTLRRQQQGGGDSTSPQHTQQHTQQLIPNRGCSPASRAANAGSPAAFVFKRSGSPHNVQQPSSATLFAPRASKPHTGDTHCEAEAAAAGGGGVGGNQPRSALTRAKVLERTLPPLNAPTRTVPPAASPSSSSSSSRHHQQNGKGDLQAYPRLTAAALRQLQQETQHLGQWRSMYDMFLAPSPTPSDACSEASVPLAPARNAADPTQEHEDLGLLNIVPMPSVLPPLLPTLEVPAPRQQLPAFRFNYDER